jgi:enoyl-CoA hydratase/carnithine racemase
LTTVSDGVGWIVFHNPERRNAMSEEMWRASAKALRRFSQDDTIRVVLMRGAGEKAFVSGGDISEFEKKMAGQTAETTARAQYAQAFEEYMSAVANLHKPLIAVIYGYCAGGGLLVALQADLRFASPNAKFSIPASKIGVGYPYDQVERLACLVGPAVAADMLFTARALDADEAKRVGLINDVFPQSELDKSATEIASVIASNAPLTILAAKTALCTYLQDPESRDIPAVDALVQACANSEDLVEGARAFLQKRKPRFVGK